MKNAETNSQELQKATAELIAQDFEITTKEEVFLSEEDLLFALADHVAQMLENRMEVLLSTLYRLDVSEAKVSRAILPNAPEPPAVGIARLIIERQKQRLQTKLTYRSEPLKDWIDF